MSGSRIQSNILIVFVCGTIAAAAASAGPRTVQETNSCLD